MLSYDTKYCAIMTAILSRIVESGNTESGTHVLNIALITQLLLRALARRQGLEAPERELALIGAAAALHDIGKAAVPAAILNKPGRLTEEEEKIMRTHAGAGAAILDSLPQYGQEPFVRCARSICLCHHERWDGGGYPRGLRGAAIPLAAQIVALADVYDALTSRRCYKPAIPHQEAVDMVLAGKCGAFNPRLLSCFEELAGSLREELAAGHI